MKISPRLKNQSESPNESEREQVERVPGAEPAPVDEPEEEDGAQRDPGPPRVQHLAAEGADAPSRHAPRDLRARSTPRTRGRRRPRPCRARSRPALPDQTLTVQTPGRRVERRVGLRAAADSGRASGRPSERRGSARRRARSVSRGARRSTGANGSSTDRARLPGRVERRSDRAAPAEGASSSASASGARPPPHRRKDQSLLPMKLSGVTSTIATACATIAPTPAVDEQVAARRGSRAASTVETTRNREPLVAPTLPALVPERPDPVQRVVVRNRDEERADRRGDVVQPRPLQRGSCRRPG